MTARFTPAAPLPLRISPTLGMCALSAKPILIRFQTDSERYVPASPTSLLLKCFSLSLVATTLASCGFIRPFVNADEKLRDIASNAMPDEADSAAELTIETST